MKAYVISALTTLLTLLTANIADADPGARNSLSVAPQKVYPKMIEAVKAEDWIKLNKALKILQPLSDEIDDILRLKLTAELEEAIADRNKKEAEKKVMELIIGGVRSLLILSSKADTPETRKEMFRQAFTEFVTIEPHLKKLDASQTYRIMTNFRGSYNIIKDKNQFITNTMIINRDLKSLIAKYSKP